MTSVQSKTQAELKKMLEDRNFWSRIKSRKLTKVDQAVVPSKASPGGTSKIISYYDSSSQYVCTIHRVTTKTGDIIHEHVKDALIEGVRYRAK
jgi:hypothetical protein